MRASVCFVYERVLITVEIRLFFTGNDGTVTVCFIARILQDSSFYFEPLLFVRQGKHGGRFLNIRNSSGIIQAFT